jgi:nucleoside-diphosphate kinase
MERTFAMVKPDGVMRRLVGEVVSRIERKGLRLAGLKLIRVSDAQARELYKVHEGKPFHPKLMKFITSAPVVVMCVEGYKAVATVRALLGKTFGFEAEPGTIRGDFAMSRGKNIVHGSDSEASAQRELPIFFKPEEMVEHAPVDLDWVYERDER